MHMNNWVRKGLALTLAMLTLLSMLPLSALAESYSAKVTASETKVYKDPSMTGTYAVAEKGTVMTVKDTKNGIAKVSRNGYTGYVDLDDLSAQAPESGENDAAEPETAVREKVTLLSPLTVYAKASTSAKKMTTPAGEQITIVSENGSWVKLERKGYTAYAKRSALDEALKAPVEITPEPTVKPTAAPTAKPTKEPIPVVVNKQSTVFAEADSASKVLGKVYKGEALNVVDVSGNWAMIDKNGKLGYMLKGNLTKAADVTPEPTVEPTVEPTKKPEAEFAPIACTVTSAKLMVYAKASTAADVLGKLSKGEQVNVIGVDGNWVLIDKDGHRGYALKGGLTPNDELQNDSDLPAVKFTATVIDDSMTIYQSASTKSAKVATVTLGTTVNVHEGGSKWARISVDGNVGYAQINAMSARTWDTYASGDSGSGVKALNEQLLELGYYDAVPGKNYNSDTTAAIKRLQGALDMEQTGKADITFMRVLKEYDRIPAASLLNASLNKGDSGSDVKRVQNRLLALGYLAKSSSVDSSYGTTTQNAVKLFQKAAGISESGNADSATLKALYDTNAPALPSGSKPADQLSSAADDPGSDDNSPLSAEGQRKANIAIDYAKSKLGCKYVYGAEGPNTFDCSGLTQTAYKQAGVSLSRSAYSVGYGSAGTKISYDGLVRGDIVCFNTISDSDSSDHVGIYLGGGKFIHASSGKAQVVISDMTSGYYNRVFSWGKRFLD